MMAFTDETLMPFGKHKGTELECVPASFLLWFYSKNLKNYKNKRGGMRQDEIWLMKYIESNSNSLNKRLEYE